MAEKIPEYVAPDIEVRPSNMPEAAWQLAGRRLSAFAAERAAGFEKAGQGLSQLAEQVQHYTTQQENIKGFSLFTQLTEQGIKAMEDASKNADPFKPNPIMGEGGVLESFNQRIDDLVNSDQFSTTASRERAAESARQLKLELFRHASVFEHERAGLVVDTAMKQAGESLGNLASAGAVDTALGQVDSFIKGLAAQHPDLSPQQLAEMQTKLNQGMRTHIISQYLGSIADKGAGEATINRAWRPEFSQFVDKEKFLQEAKTRLDQNLRNQEIVTSMKDRNDRKSYNDAINNLYGQIQWTDHGPIVPPNFVPDAQRITKEMPGGRLENKLPQVIDFAKAIADEQRSGRMDTTDPQLRQDFANRLFDVTQPLTVQELNQAKISHTLSDSDYRIFRETVLDTQRVLTENPMLQDMIRTTNESARQLILGPSEFRAFDLNGNAERAFIDWKLWAIPTFIAMLKAGKAPAEAQAFVVGKEQVERFRQQAQNGGSAYQNTQQAIPNTGTKTAPSQDDVNKVFR